jgi:hypothetical protein
MPQDLTETRTRRDERRMDEGQNGSARAGEEGRSLKYQKFSFLALAALLPRA